MDRFTKLSPRNSPQRVDAVELSAVASPAQVTPRIAEILTSLISSSPNLKQRKDAPLIAPLAELHSLTLLRAANSEMLLLVRDPRVDPVLCRWLDTEVRKARACSSQATQAEHLMSAIQRTFAPTETPLLHPIREKRFKNLTNPRDGTPRLLGEIIQNRIGVCRHVAPLLQLALQEAGISSTLLYGTLTRTEVDQPDIPPTRESHVLNIAIIDGTVRALDPMHGINEEIASITERQLSSSELFSRFQNSRAISVRPRGLLSPPIHSVFQGSQTALSGPMFVELSMLDLFMQATTRAEKSLKV